MTPRRPGPHPARTRRLVLDAGLTGVTGRYFDHSVEARPNAQADDADARARLWTRSLARLGCADPAR